MLLAEILRLTPEERIDLLEDAWDAIAQDPASVPVPAWHVEVLRERLSEPAPDYLPWTEVRERLNRPL
jgi:putative addiction module component (TIGR02574 family)